MSCDGGAKARRGSFCFTTADANANEIIAEFSECPLFPTRQPCNELLSCAFRPKKRGKLSVQEQGEPGTPTPRRSLADKTFATRDDENEREKSKKEVL